MTERDLTMNASEIVAEFQLAFETTEDPALWQKLVEEEIDEAIRAIADLLKELQDVRYVVSGLRNTAGKQGAADFLKGRKDLSDKLEFLMAIEGAIFPPDMVLEAFWLVHESNMSKLGEDGKPVRREDGKIMKGANYKAPDLYSLIVG